jgi:hypothetical protein
VHGAIQTTKNMFSKQAVVEQYIQLIEDFKSQKQ